MIVFGPVPSRRLGRSVGINNIPPKVCTYSCVYCQIGRTKTLQVKRAEFYHPNDIFQEVQEKVRKVYECEETIDYLTFVADGEPSLDVNLGRHIKLLQSLGIKIAVITNASLIWREDVRDDLMNADWVSLKLDAIHETIWHNINRPHGTLQLQLILDGMQTFADSYTGNLVTETMLVGDVNDNAEHMRTIADFLAQLKPATSYLSIPTRPPAEKWVKVPGEESINMAYQMLSSRLEHVEYLIGYEGNAFAFTGNVEEDLLSITSVHPMKEEAVRDFLTKADATWSVIEGLLTQSKLIETDFEGEKFYVRKLYTR